MAPSDHSAPEWSRLETMFDLTSSKLLILAVVALIVVGPKELPGLLRTVGRYVAMIRRQASEFRTQFDDAMRESELAEIKKDFEKLSQETQATLDDAGRSLEAEVSGIDQSVRDAASVDLPPSLAADASEIEPDLLPVAASTVAELPPPTPPVPAQPRSELAPAASVSGGA